MVEIGGKIQNFLVDFQLVINLSPIGNFVLRLPFDLEKKTFLHTRFFGDCFYEISCNVFHAEYKRFCQCYQLHFSSHCEENHTVWKLQKFTLTIFDKNFVKVITVLQMRCNVQRTIKKSWFHEIFLADWKVLVFPHCESQNFSVRKILREIIFFYWDCQKFPFGRF